MSKTAIFYGSSTGNTEAAAKQMAEKLNSDLFDVANVSSVKLIEYDNLIFGASTWGIGELQDDWEDFIIHLKDADLSGKIVAIFGYGDAETYADSFVDAIGIIFKALEGKGCILTGFTDTQEYSYDSSLAEINGKLVGLPLDEENESHLSDERINAWLEKIKNDFI